VSGGASVESAVLPLPGGTPGAVVRLTGLLTGTMEGPSAWFFREPGMLAAAKALGVVPDGARPHRFPIAAFLIEHPTAGGFIVDAGFSDAVAVSPRQALGRIGTLVFRNPRMQASQSAMHQLRERGVSVETILMTHLHWDHASGLVDFPDACVLVDRTEWWTAQRRFGSLHGYIRRQFPRSGQVRLFDSLEPAAEPWSVFKRTLDLFGDASVRLVATPGHSPGHVSLVLRLRDRLALIAGDALYTMRTLRDERHPWELGDAQRYHESFASIAAFAREHPQALIMPGHDLEAWEASGIEAGL
jgi:N-acyl homoserine lactone hydrolase